MSYSAAIDLSGSEAFFAVSDMTGKIVINIHKAMSGRSSSGLLDWLLCELDCHNIAIKDIKRWTVGSGPGSFTGMRLVAGLIIGISHGKSDVLTRCVPGAIAMGMTTNTQCGDKILTLFDGRNNEILAFELIHGENGIIASGTTAVLNKQQAAEFFAHQANIQLVALQKDIAAIQNVLPEAAYSKVNVLEKLPIENLLKSPIPYDNDLTKLTYIRPAVYK